MIGPTKAGAIAHLEPRADRAVSIHDFFRNAIIVIDGNNAGWSADAIVDYDKLVFDEVTSVGSDWLVAKTRQLGANFLLMRLAPRMTVPFAAALANHNGVTNCQLSARIVDASTDASDYQQLLQLLLRIDYIGTLDGLSRLNDIAEQSDFCLAIEQMRIESENAITWMEMWERLIDRLDQHAVYAAPSALLGPFEYQIVDDD